MISSTDWSAAAKSGVAYLAERKVPFKLVSSVASQSSSDSSSIVLNAPFKTPAAKTATSRRAVRSLICTTDAATLSSKRTSVA